MAFAIFTDADPGFKPDRFELNYLDTELHYKYRTYKILEQNDGELTKSNNPFSHVVLAVKVALTGRDVVDEELRDLIWPVIKRLIFSEMERKKIRQVMNFLLHYVRFEKQENEDKLRNEIALLTNNDREIMGTEEYLLKRARKEGKTEGSEERQMKTIINMLRRGKYTVQEIAENVDASEVFVLSVKRTIESES